MQINQGSKEGIWVNSPPEIVAIKQAFWFHAPALDDELSFTLRAIFRPGGWLESPIHSHHSGRLAQLVTRPNVPTFGTGGERSIQIRSMFLSMFVYILLSANGSEYIGMSARPDERLLEHNRGEVRSTARLRPWVKIYQEECENRLVARAREKYLKSAAGRRFRRSLRAISSAGYPPDRTRFGRSGGERSS